MSKIVFVPVLTNNMPSKNHFTSWMFSHKTWCNKLCSYSYEQKLLSFSVQCTKVLWNSKYYLYL